MCFYFWKDKLLLVPLVWSPRFFFEISHFLFYSLFIGNICTSSLYCDNHCLLKRQIMLTLTMEWYAPRYVLELKFYSGPIWKWGYLWHSSILSLLIYFLEATETIQKLIYMFNHTDISGWCNLYSPFSQYVACKKPCQVSRLHTGLRTLANQVWNCSFIQLIHRRDRAFLPNAKSNRFAFCVCKSSAATEHLTWTFLVALLKRWFHSHTQRKKENPCREKAIINRSLFSTDEYPQMKRLRLPTSLW